MSRKRSRPSRSQESPSRTVDAPVDSTRGGSAASIDIPIQRFQGIARLPLGFWIVCAVAFLLRIVWMNHEGFWADEVYVYYDAWMPLAKRLHTAHPAHFLVGRLFLEVWDSVAAIRLMAVLWAIATFPLLYDLVRRILGKRSALLAVALLAVSSYHINYSIDANYYAPVIFFSTLGLWFAARYLENAHPLDFFLTPVSLAIAFFFHPFSGVLLATSGLVLFSAAAFDGNHRRLLWPLTWWKARRKTSALVLALIEIAFLVAFCVFFVPKAKGTVLKVLSWIEFGATPRNTRFFPNLVFEYVRGNLADYPLSSRLAFSFAWPAILVTAIGWIAALRRRTLIAVLLLAPLVFSFLLITNLKAQHHFYIRYFSYMFPCLLVFFVWGCEQLAHWGTVSSDTASGDTSNPVASHLLGSTTRFGLWITIGVYLIGIGTAVAMKWTVPHPGMIAAWIIGLLFFGMAIPIRTLPFRDSTRLVTVLVGAFCLLQLATFTHRFLIRDGRNWNAVMETLETKAKPGEAILYEYPQEGEMLRYYLPRHGLSFSDTLKLPEGNPFPSTRLSQVKAMARTVPSFWLLRGWNINEPVTVRPWARQHLDFQVDGPSSFEPFLDVDLFHGHVSQRYLQSPFGIRITYRESDRVSSSENSIAWDREVDVEGATTVTLHLMNADAFSDDSITLRPRLDGQTLPASEDGSDVVLVIPEGIHRLGLQMDGVNGFTPDPVVLWSGLTLPEGIQIPASEVSLPFPEFCRADTYREKPALRLVRSLGVQYWIDFPAAGDYRLRIEAVHDKPRPVLLDIAIDDAFQGTVAFEELNNEWGVRSLPVQVPSPGLHAIAINLVQAGPGQWGLQEDEETNAILGSIQIRKATADASISDDRISFVPGQEPSIPLTLSIPVIDPESDAPLPNWIEIKGQALNTRKVLRGPLDLWKRPTVELEVPFDSKGILLVAPPKPCSPQQGAVHLEALLGTRDLLNHSVTLGAIFFDSNSAVIPNPPLFGQESTFRTTDGHRFATIEAIPPEAVAVSPVFNIFPNGKRPSLVSGWVRIAGVHVGVYP